MCPSITYEPLFPHVCVYACMILFFVRYFHGFHFVYLPASTVAQLGLPKTKRVAYLIAIAGATTLSHGSTEVKTQTKRWSFCESRQLGQLDLSYLVS